MLRSIATVSISGTLPEKLHAIAAAGYQGVEIFENDLLYYTGTPAEIRQLAADLGLKITLFQPFRDFEGASRAQFAANMARARRKFALMRELGCETLLLCSNVQPDCSADSELQVADLRALATLAEEEGIAIGYEALAWGTHVNRWQQAWERVRRVDSPALGLVLDSFHILARGDTLDALPSVPVEKITFVQLADAPYMKMDLLEWSRHFRCFPGQGELPLEAFAEQITRCGYRGPWSLEIFNDGFRASPNGATAKDGYRSLLWLEEQTRRRLPTCDADLFSPPPLPVYQGLEFIEFAASAAEASAGAGFSARGKPPLQTGDAVAQRRGADRHQPSAAQLGRPFLSTPRGIALRDGAAGRAQRVACRPRPRAGVCHLAGRRRAERNADPGDLRPRRQPYLSHRRRGGYLRARFSSA